MSEEMKNCKVCGLSVLNRIHSDAAFGHKFEPQAVTVPGDLRKTYERAKDTKSFRPVNSSSLTCSLIERLGAAEQTATDNYRRYALAMIDVGRLEAERDRLKEQLKLAHLGLGDSARMEWERLDKTNKELAEYTTHLEAKVAELEGALAKKQTAAWGTLGLEHDAAVRREALEELLGALNDKGKTLWNNKVQPNWDDAKLIVRELIESNPETKEEGK